MQLPANYRTTVWYEVLRKIATLDYYGDVDIETLYATLPNPMWSIDASLRRARKLGLIEFTGNARVSLKRWGGRRLFTPDGEPLPVHRKRRYRTVRRNVHGRIVRVRKPRKHP